MPRSPNVIVVLTDQWRAEALGCMGDDQVATPNLDAFASEGVVFERAYTPNPVCSPARGSILTGQYPHEHGVVANSFYNIDLPADRTTVAECFRDAGYDTGYIGKWHLDGGIEGPGYVPPDRRQGFDRWHGFDRGHAHLKGQPHVAADGTAEWEEGRQPDIQTDLFLEFLDERGDDPFFQFLSWGPPHTPFEAPEEYSDRYDPEDLSFRPNVPESMHEEVRGDLAEYYGMCTWLDDQFGRLLDGLDQRGLAEDTVVVFTSDHGEMMGSQGRYHKGTPFEESIHVPLLVRYPEAIEGGRRSTDVVTLVDLMPTLLGLCDVPIPEGVQGADRSGYLTDREPLESTETYVEGNLPFDDAWRALRTEQYLLAVDRTLETTHLYDTDDDPYQQQNLAGDTAASQLAAELRQRLFETAFATDDRYVKARYGSQIGPEERMALPDGL